jgi:hypothetical protein
MSRINFRGELPIGATPASLEQGEQVLFAGQVTETRSNHAGTMSLTDRRVIFEPSHRGAWPVTIPLRDLVVLELKKPMFGNLLELRVGDSRHVTTYWVQGRDSWMERIREAREQSRQPPIESAPFPAPSGVSSLAGPLQAGMPPCTVCGTLLVRLPDGSSVCPRCGPASSSV